MSSQQREKKVEDFVTHMGFIVLNSAYCLSLLESYFVTASSLEGFTAANES